MSDQRLKEAEHIISLILCAVGKLDWFAAKKLTEKHFEKWEGE